MVPDVDLATDYVVESKVAQDDDLEQRELCCPVSMELFEDPVQTPCCGNSHLHVKSYRRTPSEQEVRQALGAFEALRRKGV